MAANEGRHTSARGSTIDKKIEHECSMLGIASRRDFHVQIGAELGRAARRSAITSRKRIDQRVTLFAAEASSTSPSSSRAAA